MDFLKSHKTVTTKKCICTRHVHNNLCNNFSVNVRGEKMQLQTVFEVTVAIICAVGLLAQVNEVSIHYFAYETQPRVSAAPHYTLKVPSLSTCFRINDVLDLNHIRKQYRINSFDSNGKQNWTKKNSIRSNVPLKNILQMAPAVTEVFRGQSPACRIKYSSGDVLEDFNKSQCQRHFNVTKYFHKEYICYKFAPNLRQKTLENAEYSLVDHGPGLIYSLHLNNQALNNVRFIAVYIHDQDTLSLYDAMYTQYIVATSYSEVNPTYNTVHEEGLEPPYDTNCQKYPRKLSFVQLSLQRVQKEILKRFKKLTPSLMLEEKDIPDNVTLFYSQDTKRNRTLSKLYRQIYNEHLFVARSRGACTFRCTVSKLSFGANDHLLFRVMWPDGLEVNIQHVKKLVIIDYVIYICSCIGIWFGVSIYTCFGYLKSVLLKSINEGRTQSDTSSSDRSMRTEMRRNQFINDRRFQEINRALQRMNYDYRVQF